MVLIKLVEKNIQTMKHIIRDLSHPLIIEDRKILLEQYERLYDVTCLAIKVAHLDIKLDDILPPMQVKNNYS